MYIVVQIDYMFRLVEAIIRSLSFDAFKSTLNNYVWCVWCGDLDIKAFFVGIIYLDIVCSWTMQ